MTQSAISTYSSELSTHGQYLTTHDVFKMILSYASPLAVAGLVYTFVDYLSAYYYMQLFGSSFIIAYAATIPLLQVFTQTIPMGLATYFQINSGWLLSQHKKEKAAEQYSFYMRAVIILGILCVLGFATWSPKQLDLFNVGAAFQTNYIVQLVCGFFFVSFNNAMSGRYCMESRRLLTLSRGFISALLFCFFEALVYSFYFGSATVKPTTNWPTTLAYVLANVVCTVWTQALAGGYSALGVTTKEIFYNKIKDILDFRNMFSKQSMKSLLIYAGYGITTAILNMASGIAVLLCVYSIQSTFTNQSDMFNGITDLFVFCYFGAIFRVVPTAVNQAFIQAAIVCIKIHKYARLREMIYKSFLIALVFNGLVCIIFIFVKIIYIFMSSADFEAYESAGRMTSAILFSGLTGVGQIIVELTLSLSIIEKDFIVTFMIALGKLVQAILSSMNLKKNNGDRANYLLVLLFTECNAIASSCVFIIMYIIKFKWFSKEEGVEKKKVERGKKKAAKKAENV